MTNFWDFTLPRHMCTILQGLMWGEKYSQRQSSRKPRENFLHVFKIWLQYIVTMFSEN